eukprot:9892-Heterococcus_DN1.PRE.2
MLLCVMPRHAHHVPNCACSELAPDSLFADLPARCSPDHLDSCGKADLHLAKKAGVAIALEPPAATFFTHFCNGHPDCSPNTSTLTMAVVDKSALRMSERPHSPQSRQCVEKYGSVAENRQRVLATTLRASEAQAVCKVFVSCAFGEVSYADNVCQASAAHER